jgi:hypothetical protein
MLYFYDFTIYINELYGKHFFVTHTNFSVDHNLETRIF